MSSNVLSRFSCNANPIEKETKSRRIFLKITEISRFLVSQKRNLGKDRQKLKTTITRGGVENGFFLEMRLGLGNSVDIERLEGRQGISKSQCKSGCISNREKSFRLDIVGPWPCG